MGQKERQKGRVVGYGAVRARFEALPQQRRRQDRRPEGGKGGKLYQRAEASAEATDENKSYRTTWQISRRNLSCIVRARACTSLEEMLGGEQQETSRSRLTLHFGGKGGIR